MKKMALLIPLTAAVLLSCLSVRTNEYEPAAARPVHGFLIVLDAGHGGADGGAVAEDGTEEADLNLKVALCMRDLLGLYGVLPLMTRDAAEIPYPAEAETLREKKVWDQKERLSRINGTPNALLVSIHQNQYTASSASGAQVLWAPTEGSETLAVWLQSLLLTHLDPENRRTASQISGSIWLMNRINCPGVLVECGFLSNQKELSLLKNDQYRRKLSGILVSGCLTWADTYAKYGGMFDGENGLFLH